MNETIKLKRGTDGRAKLDRLVAKHVMRWTIYEDWSDTLYYYSVDTGATGLEVDRWKPSADMNDAMRVYLNFQTRRMFQEKNSGYYIRFADDLKGVYHANLPVAICLAALRAKGVDVEIV